MSEQHSPHMDSMNGELSMMRHQHAINCSEYPMYPLLCPGDAYAHQSAHLLPASQLKQDRHEQEYHQPTSKYPYRCDETLHKYPKRCTEEYHRCSEGNVVYASEQKYPIVDVAAQQNYQAVVDLQKYPQRYADYATQQQQQHVVSDEAGFYNYNTDLQKFPQRYSEDPHVRMQQPSVKYNLRCNEHGYNYPPMGRNVYQNQMSHNSGLPLIGQTAIGLVVNRFNSGTGQMAPQGEFAYAKSAICVNNGNEEDTMNLRYATNSISDNEDI